MARLALVILALYVVAGVATMEPVTAGSGVDCPGKPAMSSCRTRATSIQDIVPLIGTREGEAEAYDRVGPSSSAEERRPYKPDAVGPNPTLAPSSVDREPISDRSGNHGVADIGDSDPVDRAGRLADIQRNPQLAVQGLATWVHPSLAGGLMADNATRYDPTASGLVAATSWPVGTLLRVQGPTGRALLVQVRDTGILGANHLDMSESDFVVLGGRMEVGVIEVSIGVMP